MDEQATGNPIIDAALGELAKLADLPVEEHPSIFDAIHGQLRAALTEPQEPS